MSLPSISRWSNRTALVTGASAGIGAAISEALVKHGIKVVGCARNEQKIQSLSISLKEKNYAGELIPYKCDVSKDEELEKMFEWIENHHGGVDICVNNAGFSYDSPLLDTTGSEIREMLDVNVVALTLCASNAVRSMKRRGVNDGHIFNISSLSGHQMPRTTPLSFYAATKHAVTAITEGLRRELVEHATKIRVTAISPGIVETEFFTRTFNENHATELYSTVDVLKASDIADIVVFALSAPPNVQVHDVIVRPVGMKS